MRVNADAFAGIPLRVWKTREEDADEADETDKLVQLLSKPNPLMGGTKLLRAMSRALDLDGGVFLFLCHPGLEPIMPGEMPEELWPVRDALVTPEYVERDAKGRPNPTPDAWSFQIRETKYTFPASSVARIYWPDDANPLLAFGPAQAAWREADHLFRAEAFDDGLVENGGQMAGYFTHEERRLDPDKLDTLKKSTKQRVNAPKNDRSTPILPAGITFTPTAFTQVEMQAGEMRKVKREGIARTFGVPPVMLGEMEDANRSSLRELRRVYYENTIAPRATFVEEELVQQLIPRLPGKFAGYWIQLDVAQTAAMREDTDALIERAEKLVHLGVSFEDAAAMIGFDHDPIEGEDERWIASTLTPVELALNPPEPVVEPPPPEEKSHQTRRKRAQEFEAQLAKHDNAIARATNKVFRHYLSVQEKKIRALLGQKSEPAVVRPWPEFLGVPASWSPNVRAYAELMDLVPEREWVEDVRGITPDELERILERNAQRWGEELWKEVEKPIKTALLDSAKNVAIDLGKVSITAANPRALRHMATKRVQLVEGPMSVVAERVRAVIVKAMANASNVGTLADRVRSVLEELESQLAVMRDQLGTRAMMIARTESAAAANAGRVAQFKASGIGAHEWVTAGDDLVREGHQIDGETQVIGQRFSNGMTEPGEAGAPPEMVIQCRCTTAPVIADESSAFAASARPVLTRT